MEVLYTQQLQPDIIVNGLRIGEPVVSLTAMLMSLVCLYIWLQLRAFAPENKVLRLYRLFFAWMAISGLLGGLLGHAFLYRFPFIVKMPGWVSGIISTACLAQVSIARLRAFEQDSPHKAFTMLNVAAAVLALGILASTLWFPIVEFHTAFGLLLVVGVVETSLWRRRQLKSSAYMLMAIPFAVMAAAVHVAKFSLSPWFTFFDIGHVFVCGTFWMIYRAALTFPADAGIHTPPSTPD